MNIKGLLASLALLLTACAADTDTVVLRVGHALDPTHSVHKAMEEMDRKLREYSGNKMQIRIYPSSQLGSERELIELLQIGSLAMTKVSAAPLESFVAEIGVFGIPYIFEDYDHYVRVIDSDIGQGLLASLDRSELVGLGYYDAGARSFYTIDKPVHTPADLDGMKIRVMKSQTAMRMVNTLGAAATPISFGELYTALQQGVIDGAENNPPSFYLTRHFEVARYYTIDEHTFVPDVLLLSKHIYDNLSAQQREWLQAAARDSIEFQRELWKVDSQAAMDAVEAAGVTIIHPDKSTFKEGVSSMHESHPNPVVLQLIEDIKAMGSDQ